MKIIIHRGTKEIGGTCIELKSKNTTILLDFGLPLVYKGEEFDSSKYKNESVESLKALKILPDIQGIYKGDSQNNTVSAIVLSHSHLDHYGLLDKLKPEIPIYLSAGAKKMIEVSSIFTQLRVDLENPKVIKAKQEFTIGDFKIIPYAVGHSAFNALAFYIEAEGIKIFYTGDFRMHGRTIGDIELISKKHHNEIDYLIMEGTMFGRDAPFRKDEDYVKNKALSLMKKTEGLVLLMFSPQNIDRLVSLFKATASAKRRFVVDIYTAYLLDNIKDMAKTPNSAWGNVKVFHPEKQSKRLWIKGEKDILEKYRTKNVKLDYIQAYQSELSVLFRNSMIPDFENISNSKKGLLIYSMYEGYLKQPGFKKLDVFLEKKNIVREIVHVSGHAYIGDLKKFADDLVPKQIIPIHTFHPEQYRELFGDKIKEIEDGKAVEL
ncbi:MAG: MBL fold metallo-hydrolase [bacterium]